MIQQSQIYRLNKGNTKKILFVHDPDISIRCLYVPQNTYNTNISLTIYWAHYALVSLQCLQSRGHSLLLLSLYYQNWYCTQCCDDRMPSHHSDLLLSVFAFYFYLMFLQSVQHISSGIHIHINVLMCIYMHIYMEL